MYAVAAEFEISGVGTVANFPHYIVHIPQDKWTFAEASKYSAMTNEQKWNYLFCHPFATVRSWEGFQIRGKTAKLKLFMPLTQWFQLDQLEDLGDSESSGAYSGSLSVSDAAATPAISNTIPTTLVSIYPDTGGSTGETHPFLTRIWLLPGSAGGSFATQTIKIKSKLTRYVYMYELKPAVTDTYSETA